jgi:hypothetical protein
VIVMEVEVEEVVVRIVLLCSGGLVCWYGTVEFSTSLCRCLHD